MQPADRKIILVVRETRLDELTARFNTVQQARFYVEHLGSDFGDYLEEQRQLHAATREVETSLRAFGRVQRLDRRYLGNFIFGADDIVVFVGGVIPRQDYEFLFDAGVKGIYGPGTPIPASAKDVLEQIKRSLAGH